MQFKQENKLYCIFKNTKREELVITNIGINLDSTINSIKDYKEYIEMKPNSFYLENTTEDKIQKLIKKL